jgi:beta-1,4-mannosyl-glycoprotein beta-1,4-N-acetylglucosaminyltransferase
MSVYCAFQFFNEFEILKLKMEELWDVVDYFIVSESDHTHSGLPKEFNFLTNYGYFSKYHKKIIWQGIMNTPSDYNNLKYNSDHIYNGIIDKLNNQTHWNKSVESYGRDSFEKESLIRPLTNCKDYDIIILGDCDEIPKAKTLKEIIDNFESDKIYHMQHDFYWYYMNILKDESWYGNIVCSYKTFKENSFCEMRQNKQGIFIDSGGWHFTYMGGVDKIKKKIESWGEQSLNLPYVKDNIEKNLNDFILSGRDLFFRPAKFTKVPVEYKTHPKYLVDNQEEYRNFILE